MKRMKSRCQLASYLELSSRITACRGQGLFLYDDFQQLNKKRENKALLRTFDTSALVSPPSDDTAGCAARGPIERNLELAVVSHSRNVPLSYQRQCELFSGPPMILYPPEI
jgi:hypothetical protein